METARFADRNMTPITEAGIRVGCFVGVFAAMAIWEMLAPRRPVSVRKSLRWLSNLGLVAVNSVLVRLVLPLSAFGTALVAAERGWGLLNHWNAPLWIKF